MPTKYIDNSAYAVSGYTLSGVFQSITIGSAGIIGGPGIVGGTKAAYTIANAGRITGTNTAISLADGGTVSNTGKIRATAGNGIGVRIAKTGLVNNTGTGVIQGDYGVSLASGSVVNAGTIIGIGTKAIGVYLATGTVTNLGGGSIDGNRYGVAIRSVGGLYNAGTVSALTVGVGIVTGTVTNHGLIDGKIGIKGVDAGTVTNFGTIESTTGATGIAVDFTYQHDTFVDEASSVTVGTIVGDGGTLVLAGATGTLSGLGANFSGFGTVDLAAGADWVVNGSDTVTGGFNVAGTLDVLGTLGGTGTLALAGTETLASAKLTVADLTLTAGTATLGGNLTYTGSFAESGGTLALDSRVLALEDAASFTGGTIDGSGNVQTFASTTLVGLTLDGGATWQDYGTVTDTGTLTLGDGYGGTGRLVVEAGGVFDFAGYHDLLQSESNIVNSGLFEETASTGFNYVTCPMNNSGTIVANGADLILQGRITGTGSSTIGSAGQLEFDGGVPNTQTVTFASTSGGVLQLNFATGFAGTIYGFGGSDEIVLGLGYVGAMHPTWSQDGSIGTLTVTEGTESASIILFGQYTSANFMASNHGNTLVTYVPTSNQNTQLAPPHH